MPNPTRKPRVCAVSYLNTIPLVWGMLHGDQQGLFDLDFRIPAQCADRLASGEADIGIAPAVEVPRIKLAIVSRNCIASDGAVRSILLVSKTPLDQVRVLAADSSSRTSVALTRVILARKYGVTPAIVRHDPDTEAMLHVADAAVIIGDPALRVEPSRLPYLVKDLGEEWKAMTGLPMVFAVWAGREEFATSEIAERFEASYRFGAARLDEIVAQESAPRGLDKALAYDYLARLMRFELGPREMQGLELFLKYASELPAADKAGKVSL
ncbi:MAG: menaquinone biosynthesis protein [Bryobacteraceae bacterium]